MLPSGEQGGCHLLRDWFINNNNVDGSIILMSTSNIIEKKQDAVTCGVT